METIDEVKAFDLYTLVKYHGSRRYETFPSLDILTDAAVLDFVEFVQEKGIVQPQGKYIHYRRF